MPSMLFVSISMMSLFFLSGCGGCAKKGVVEPEPSVAEALASDAEQEAEVVPEKETVTVALFPVGEKVTLWIEARSGTVSADMAQVFQQEGRFLLPDNEGWRSFGVDGTNYAFVGGPTENAVSVAGLLAEQSSPPAGYRWEMSTLPNGQARVNVQTASGKSVRIGVFQSELGEPAWLEIDPPASSASPAALDANSGWATSSGGIFLNQVPEAAVAVDPGAAAEVSTWKSELALIRGGAVDVKISTTVNLDADEATEGFVCVTGGEGNPCYIVDVVADSNRYYSTAIHWNGGEDADAPNVFTLADGTYIMHGPSSSAASEGGSNVIRVVRFDGLGFVTDTIQ